jgi:hypothetical protein
MYNEWDEQQPGAQPTMTLVIDLAPEEQALLERAAELSGLRPADFAKKIVKDHLPRDGNEEETEDPTIALFAKWTEEDANMTPEELEEAKRDLDEFKANINAERKRAGARIMYP